MALLVSMLGMNCAHAAGSTGSAYTWTTLIPEQDSRPRDVRAQDEWSTEVMVSSMNKTEKVFHGQLNWQTAKINDLLSISAPFCELDFDMVKPFHLTSHEKGILKEFLGRGGFLLLAEDAYPYTDEEILKVHSWPVIDFITKELPAQNHDFQIVKVSNAHPILHQFYQTKMLDAEINEFRINPYLPDFQLLTYRGHPCAFIYANYTCDDKDDRWVTEERPFSSLIMPEDYAFNVNLYIYVTSH